MADTLESLEIEVKHSASGAAQEIKEVANAIKLLAKALDKAIPKLQVFNDAMGKKRPKNISIVTNDNHTTQIADSITNVREASQKASGATEKASKGISKLQSAASKASGQLKTFVDSLKRIAFYRFIRAIIKAITQAFQEGLQHAYEFSSALETVTGHRFASAMDSMSSSAAKMKNQLGSAFISLLTAIAPVVNQIIALVVRLADALSQLFAAFTGGTYLKAKDTFQSWGETAEAGAAATKEWKNQLLGFDVINRLEAPSDSGGGGGNNLDIMGMFEDTPIDGIFAKMKAKLDELKESLDFTNLKEKWEEFKSVLSGFADLVENRIGFVWDTYFVPLAHWMIESGLPGVLAVLSGALSVLEAILRRLEPYIESFEEFVLVPLMEWDLQRITDGLDGLADVLQRLADLINGDITFEEFWSGLDLSVDKILGWINPIHTVAKEVGNFFGEEIGVLIGITIQDFNDLVTDIKDIWNKFKKWLEDKWNELSEWWRGLKLGSFHIALPRIVVTGQFSLKPLSVPSFHLEWPEYAEGGFPEDGFFLANHKELVGQFSNGKTAVANNQEIIEGIKQGVIEALLSVDSRSNNSQPHIAVLEVNGREFCRATYSDNQAVAREHGVSLIVR